MKRLYWDKLLCEERIRKSFESGNSVRNAFEADYDRIVGSSSVRRLQDKAQVFPLQPDDVVRTRLTHSIEVSAMAASLGKRIGKNLEKRKEMEISQREQLISLLQTAGLIHDLGNPPFGHYGESVIRNWYREEVIEKKGVYTEDNLSQYDKDFLYFDGNVQNLRIVSKLQTLNDEYGANFTFGTLATIIKYPYNSCNTRHPKGKFGYYKTEEDLVERIFYKTGLEEGVRHPATYLLEAADDIVYICDDIEDGVKKGVIPWGNVYSTLLKKYDGDSRYKDLFKRIKDKVINDEVSEKEKNITQVRFFRNYVQGFLIDVAESNFMSNYDDIMNGRFGLKELLCTDDKLVKELKEITSKYCFTCEEVLSLELVGDKVLKELLNVFYTLVNADEKKLENTYCYEGKIYNLISDNYRFIYKNELKKMNDDADRIKNLKFHLIVEFISGMTDSYAVRLYKRLSGVDLPI